MLRSTFSTTTMASSITMPIARISPNSVSRFSEKPSAYMPLKAPTSATNTATMQMKVARKLCRKRYTTSTTSTIASNSVLITSLIDRRTKSVVSSAMTVSMPGGRVGAICVSAARTPSETCSALAPGCW